MITLDQSVFSTEEQCVKYLERVRWPTQPICPYCAAKKSTPMKDNRHHCNCCGTTFSITVRTIFHDTRIPLKKWFMAIKLILDTESRISSRKLAKDLGINRNTASRLINRVYGAMANTDDRQLLLGIVEMQEQTI